MFLLVILKYFFEPHKRFWPHSFFFLTVWGCDVILFFGEGVVHYVKKLFLPGTICVLILGSFIKRVRVKISAQFSETKLRKKSLCNSGLQQDIIKAGERPLKTIATCFVKLHFFFYLLLPPR